jgi:hypothetical protein
MGSLSGEAEKSQIQNAEGKIKSISSILHFAL